jgi:hypothetical protein
MLRGNSPCFRMMPLVDATCMRHGESQRGQGVRSAGTGLGLPISGTTSHSHAPRPCTHKSRLVSGGWSMAALPPIADICQRIEYVCFVPLTDIWSGRLMRRRDCPSTSFGLLHGRRFPGVVVDRAITGSAAPHVAIVERVTYRSAAPRSTATSRSRDYKRRRVLPEGPWRQTSRACRCSA